MLKKSANRRYDYAVKEYLNPLVIIAYFLFLISTILTTLAYKYVPVSLGPVLEASGYIFVAVLSFLFLKEKISRRKFFGLMIILLGILISNI